MQRETHTEMAFARGKPDMQSFVRELNLKKVFDPNTDCANCGIRYDVWFQYFSIFYAERT